MRAITSKNKDDLGLFQFEIMALSKFLEGVLTFYYSKSEPDTPLFHRNLQVK